MHNRLLSLGLVAAVATPSIVAGEGTADAGDEVQVLILKEQGVGSASTAQSYVDSLMVHLARANGWSAAKGSYQTKRAAAKEHIAAVSPQYGILSLGAFLALRAEYKLQVVGEADVEGGGGIQYYVVSKNHADVASCKGKTLATNHAGDKPFVEKVIARGAFTLADFTVVTTTRPVQTLKKVISGEAECALIDDAQLAELGNLEGGAAVHSVWLSAIMPPMPIVAFGNAPAEGVKTFKAALGSVCTGEGAKACAAAGIKALHESDAAPYQVVIDAWSAK